MASEKIILHINNCELDSHKVPASLLVSMLTNLEDLFYLMAKEDEGVSFDSRLRVSDEMKRKYKFFCEVPQVGSYSLPIDVESPERENNLFEQKEPTATRFGRLLTEKNSNETYKHYFQTRASQAKAFALTQAAFPQKDCGYYVDIVSSSGASRDSRTIQSEIETITQKSQNEFDDVSNFSVVNGYLQKIDLKSNSIELSYPPTRRTFKCHYKTDEMAETILKLAAEDKDKLLQVCGNLILNDKDEPKMLSDLASIAFIDESPIEITSFERNNKRYSFKEPIQFKPCLDDSKQLYLLEYPELGIDIAVYTRAELKTEIEEQIVFLWEEYAEEDDEKLTSSALELKRSIKSILTVEDL